MSSLRRAWLLAPLHAVALATGAKSFRDNVLIGNPALNRFGLHVGRMRLADAMAEQRRQRLAHLVSTADAAAFQRDGFVLRPDFLPQPLFAALKQQVMTLAAPARDMVQGDTVTRRIAVDGAYLGRAPALRALVDNPDWLGLVRYVASSALMPMTYVQSIFSHARAAPADPQTRLHADTFHPSVKAWFFLTTIADDEAPFIYVPGSHRLTARRLAWERRRSIGAGLSADFQSARGSLRITAAEVGRLGLGAARRFAVPENTLVVADTRGFHARGDGARPAVRIEIWAYGRRNPFLPWTGFDLAAAPLIKGRAVPLLWQAMDLGERFGVKRNPWRPAGMVTPDAPPDLRRLD